VPTFQQVLDLRARLSRELGRPVGVYPETKHPTYHDSLGLSLEESLVRALDRNRLNRRGAPVFVQSFEVANLKELSGELRCRSSSSSAPRASRSTPQREPVPAARAAQLVASDYGDALAEYAAYFAAGIDGLFSDNPDTAVAARALLEEE
jgi:glycerophosphoryl diester phosphodiesterase